MLQAANYAGVPLGGATAANTPFPSWRCIANVLLNDEPAEKCNAVVNRTAAAIDGRSRLLREPVPGSLHANFHVEATR